MGNISPFGTTWGDFSANSANFMSGDGRMDNMITYKTPNFAGFNVYAQYSFDNNSAADNNPDADVTAHGIEGKSSVDRYYGLGATYKNSALSLAFVVDSTNYSTDFYGSDVDDALTVSFGGSYDFGVVKPYLGVQYFDNADYSTIGIVDSFTDGGADRGDGWAEGWAVTVGTDIPVFGGTAKFGVSYIDADYESYAEGTDVFKGDFSAWAVSAGYQYSLSKRTSVYGALSYASFEDNEDGASSVKPSAVEAGLGLVHLF